MDAYSFWQGYAEWDVESTETRTGSSVQRNKVNFRYSTGQRLGGLDHTDLGPKATLVENRSKRSSTPNQLILKFKLSSLSFLIIVNTFRPRYTPNKAEAGTEGRRSRGFDNWFLGEIVKTSGLMTGL